LARGKPVGSDLRQGLITLPTLFYLEQHPEDELIVRLFRSNEHRSEEAIHQAVSTIRESGAVEAALDEARGFVGRSRSALDPLPAGTARQAMQDLADFTVQRRT
jgi:heptaprenyl diphosphate synthase